MPSIATLVEPKSLGIARYARTLQEALRPLGWTTAGLADADVVHVHYGNSSRQLALRAATQGKPLVVTVHDAVPRHRVLRLVVGSRWVRKWTKIADEVVVHNEAARRMIGGRAQVVPMMAFPSAASSQPHAEAKSGPMQIGMFGRMAGHKGLDWLAASLRHLEGVPMQLTLCGPGARDAARRLAWPHILAVEGANDDEFDALIARQDAVLSIRSESVGESSSVSAQAIGLGVPIISNTGNPTHADFGRACIDVASPLALADALRDLAARPDHRTRLRSEAREASRLCALATVAATYDGILRSAKDGAA